ncbi:MAG: flagellar hook-associated protein FlgK [Planctomycetota bacterium]
MSIFSSLNIGISGLESYLRALQITSHNIANANTPGFSKQRVIFTQNNAIDLGFARLPTGVSIAEIKRVVDPALFFNIQKRLNQFGSATVLKNAFVRIEGFSNETNGGGIIDELRNFFQTLSSFASDTDNQSIKNHLIMNAKILLDKLKIYTQNLDTLLSDFQNTLPDKVSQINIKLQEIASINQTVVQTEKAGIQNETANDLRDKREVIVKELSQLMNINSFEDKFGNLNISINGEILVNGKDVNPLVVSEKVENGKIIKSIRTVNTNAEIIPTRGEIGAIFQLKNEINDIKLNLTEIFRGLIFEFNKLHSRGSGKDIFENMTSKLSFPESSKVNPLQQEIEVNTKSKFQIQVNNLVGNPDGSFKDYYILKNTSTGGNVIAKVTDFFGASGTIITDREISVNPGEKLYLSALPFTIKNGSFDIVTINLTDNTQKVVNIPIDLDTIPPDATLNSLVATMNSVFTSNSLPLIASITSDNKLNIVSTNSQIKFYFNNDSSNFLSASQLNPFFTGFSLENIEVNDELKDNLNFISYAEDFLSQDNSIALQLLELKDKAVFDSGESITTKLTNFFANLAGKIENANTNFELENDLVVQLETERERISGVNLEEEAANLILYQKAFTANAKFIQAVNNVFDTLLSII